MVTNQRIKPAIKSYAGIRCQFIHHDVSRFFGYSSLWINTFERAMVSDLEKTLVDIATKPQYGGGIVQIGNAIFKAKDRINSDKLFYYLARNGKKSAKKRFLYLSDLLGLEWSAEHDRMMAELGSGITLLDPEAPDQGRKRIKFGLRVNMDSDLIGREIET